MFDIDTPKEMKLLRKINKLQAKAKDNSASISALGIDPDDFFLQQLIRKGYVSYTKYDNWGANKDGFVLTDEGKQVSYYRSQRTKDLIKKSIVLPIVVAFLTTLATNYLLPAIISLITK